MSFICQRGDKCNAFFEDFTYEQRGLNCVVCLRCEPVVYCLGGSHRRAPLVVPAGSAVFLNWTAREGPTPLSATGSSFSNPTPISSSLSSLSTVIIRSAETASASSAIGTSSILETTSDVQAAVGAITTASLVGGTAAAAVAAGTLFIAALDTDLTTLDGTSVARPTESSITAALNSSIAPGTDLTGVSGALKPSITGTAVDIPDAMRSSIAPGTDLTGVSGELKPSITGGGDIRDAMNSSIAPGTDLTGVSGALKPSITTGVFRDAMNSSIAPGTDLTGVSGALKPSITGGGDIRDAMNSSNAPGTDLTGVSGLKPSITTGVFRDAMKSFIAPGTDLTTVAGISDALNGIVRFLEQIEPATFRIISEAGNSASCQAFVQLLLLDAIPAYIGYDDGSKAKAEALEAPGTNIIVNLIKLLNLLFKLASSPSEPSYPSTAAKYLAGALVAVQKMTRCDYYYLKEGIPVTFFVNVQAFEREGICEVLVAILKYYYYLVRHVSRLRLLSASVAGGGEWWWLLPGGGGQEEEVEVDPVVSACCLAIRNITAAATAKASCESIGTSMIGKKKYESVPGSMEVLVGALKIYKNVHSDAGVAVTEACCGAIKNITSGHADNQSKYGAVPGSVEAVVYVLRARTDNPTAEVCIKALWTLVENHPANLQQLCAIPGHFKLLVRVLQDHYSSGGTALAHACCKVIRDVTTITTTVTISNDDDDDIDCGGQEVAAIAVSSGLYRVLEAIFRVHGHIKGGAVAQVCCEIIENTTATRRNNNIPVKQGDSSLKHQQHQQQKRIEYKSVSGCVTALVTTLKIHHGTPNNAFLAKVCCGAIRNIAALNTVYGSMWAEESLLQELFHVLNVYGTSDNAVAEACCGAIGDVTAGAVAANGYTVSVEQSFMKSLADVLKTYSASSTGTSSVNATVVEGCVRSIWNLTYVSRRGDSSVDYYCKIQGSIELLVDVLKTDGRSIAAVAGACCGAIINIISACSRVNKFLAADVFLALAAVLKAHGKVNTDANKLALGQCCLAIEALCVFIIPASRAKVVESNIKHVLKTQVTVLEPDNKPRIRAYKALRKVINGAK